MLKYEHCHGIFRFCIMSNFLLRTGLMMLPIACVPLAMLLKSASAILPVSINCQYLSDAILSFIPLFFAIAASLTEINNSRSWQIISTVLVYMTLHALFLQFIPGFSNPEYAVCYFSAIITAAMCSHITANTKYLKRYLISRALNLCILFGGCLAAVVLSMLIGWVLRTIFGDHGESTFLATLPVKVREYLTGFAYEGLHPFGANVLLSDYMLNNPELNEVKSRELFCFYNFIIQIFCLPALLTALFTKLDSKKRLPVLFLVLMCLFSTYYPQAETLILLTIIWMWPGLFLAHVVLAGFVYGLVREFGMSVHFSGDISIRKAADAALSANALSNVCLILFCALCYFTLTHYVLGKYPLNNISWKIKKTRPIVIRMIRDRKGSKDLSLLAIRILKMIGGLDNLVWVDESGDVITIRYSDGKMINNDALKSIGRESRNENEAKLIYIKASDAAIASEITKKIRIFAKRQFVDATQRS